MKSHRFIFIVIIFLIIKLFFFKVYNVGWDSAVYLNMGKFMFSLGKSGLWEPSRPLIWPIILGVIWKLNLNHILFGKIIDLLFSIGCIFLTYLIGRELFDNKVALISSIFLAFSVSFFSFSGSALTGIVSTFFSLLAVYYFIKKRLFLAGLFVGIAFMTRFLQLIGLIGLGIILLIYQYKNKKLLIYFATGFLLAVIPYLVLNYILYGNIMYPFLLQIFLTTFTGSIWWEPFWFYFRGLVKDNILVVFSLAGLFLCFKAKDYRKKTIASVFLIFLVFFSLEKHKEMRFAVVFLPYLYLLTSYGIFRILKKIRLRKISLAILLILILLFVFQSFPQYKRIELPDYSVYTDYVATEAVSDGIWISNPIFIVFSDKRADRLIYYPTFDSNKINELLAKIGDAQHILIDSCDILCNPFDEDCKENESRFYRELEENFDLKYYKEINGCNRYIFAT